MRVVPATDLDDGEFASALALVQRCEIQLDPAVPPITAEELRRFIADDRSDANVHVRTAAVDGTGTVRAVGHLELETDPGNDHYASAEIFGAAGDPAVGALVLADIVERAAADGRTTLAGWGPDTEAESQFWTGFGATPRYEERISALDVTAVDADLMAAWIEQRTERADDVELVRWVGPCPAAHRPAFARSVTAMSYAPTDVIYINPLTITEDDVIEMDYARAGLGYRSRTLFALTPDGDPVGHTTVMVNPFRPGASWQWDTVVLAAHRERGIGRWLKSEMWRWLRATEPEVDRLVTGNAESNTAMLAINVAMGYRPAYSFRVWQADLDTYRAALG